MPKLVKMYIRNVVIGFGVAGVFVALLLAFDVQNLWTLVSHSGSGVLAVFMLWFMNGIVFAGVQFGWAIMSMAEKPDRGQGGTPIAHDFGAQHEPVPVRVPTQDPRQTHPHHR